MLGRKKYRKGKKYTYVVSGTFSSGSYGDAQDKVFVSANSLRIINSMDALEMFGEVMRHVKIVQGVKPDHPVFINSYHIESN